MLYNKYIIKIRVQDRDILYSYSYIHMLYLILIKIHINFYVSHDCRMTSGKLLDWSRSSFLLN